MLPASICNREHQQEAFSRSHILFPHCTEFLLTGSVQYWKANVSTDLHFYAITTCEHSAALLAINRLRVRSHQLWSRVWPWASRSPTHTHRHTHLLPCSIFQYRWKRDALKIERFGTVLAGRSRKKWKGGETMYHPRCHLLQIHIMNYMHFMWKKATFWKKFWGQGGGKVKVMHNNTVLDVTDCMAYISTQAQRANSDRWAHRPTGNTAPFRKAYSKHTWLLETGIQQTTLHNIL